MEIWVPGVYVRNSNMDSVAKIRLQYRALAATGGGFIITSD